MTHTQSENGTISLAAFARLVGVSRQRISQAIKGGILSTSVVMVGRRPAIASAEAGLAEWAAVVDRSKAPGYVKSRAEVVPAAEPEEYSLAKESAKEKHFKAKLAQHQFELESGRYILIEEARAAVIKDYSEIRSKLLGVPSRLKQRDGSLSLRQLHTVDELIREALESLADETHRQGK